MFSTGRSETNDMKPAATCFDVPSLSVITSGSALLVRAGRLIGPRAISVIITYDWLKSRPFWTAYVVTLTEALKA
jgi:hypothetical protein